MEENFRRRETYCCPHPRSISKASRMSSELPQSRCGFLLSEIRQCVFRSYIFQCSQYAFGREMEGEVITQGHRQNTFLSPVLSVLHDQSQILGRPKISLFSLDEVRRRLSILPEPLSTQFFSLLTALNGSIACREKNEQSSLSCVLRPQPQNVYSLKMQNLY